MKNNTDESLAHNYQNLHQEIDHYFQAELGHDQRVSWLLALSSGIMFVIGNYIIGIKKGEIDISALWWLISAELFILASIVVFIFSLWPLAGSKGNYWKPWHRKENSELIEIDHFSDKWLFHHFHAHKYRAKKKACLIVWGTIALIGGLVCTVISLFIGCL